jgi:HK97 gp10 family phage protein
VSIKIDLRQLKAGLAAERKRIADAARPAAQAGAQVVYDAARALVPVSQKGHWFYGTSYKKTGQKYWFDAGSLRNSIYQVYSQDNSSDSKATYHVSWNSKKAPYAWMVEFGTSRAAAHPFMGPAIHDYRDMVGQAMRQRFLQEVKA